ncbi:MAG: hypothetical protein ACTSPN_01090 [Promethearchaeota archaeon]
MLSILLLIEIIIILVSGMSIFFINKQKERKEIIFWIISSSLIINTFSLFIVLFMNLQFYEFYLIIDGNVLLIVEFILLGGMFYAIISKNNDKKSINIPIHDGISLLILAGIMGIVSSSHLLILISWLAFVLILLGVNLFYGKIPIDFKNCIPYFLSIGISLVALYIFSIIIFIDTGTIYLIEIKSIGVSSELNFIYIILIIIGFGIPCGIFPFGVFHLKKVFQDGSYYNLLFYFMINYSISFSLFRSFQFFEFLPLGYGLIVTIISILGIIIFSYVILKELFFSLEEQSFSLKRIMGYSITGDFNNILMLLSISLLIPAHIRETYLNGLFLIFSLFILVKTLVLFALHPITLTYEDDSIIKEKVRIYSKLLQYLLYITGAIIAFPLSFYSFWILNEVLNVPEVQSNSAFTFLIVFIIVLHLLYNMISLITISTINLESYNNKILKTEKKESDLFDISIESKIVIFFTLFLGLLVNCLFFLNIFSYVLL